MQVQSYLNYIGVKEIEDKKQMLYDIHKHHLLKVPFENLDIMNGVKLSMNTKDLFDKLVGSNRGGICFETNTLLHWVLTELGYDVSFLSASLWNEEKEAYNPDCSHLALLVQLDKNYLVDVGVGGGFLYPLVIEGGFTYKDANGTYEVKQVDEQNYLVMKQEEGVWMKLFTFSTEPRKLEEFHPQCHYYETSPDTFFTQKRLISRITENGRVTLKEEKLKVTTLEEVKEFPITSEEEWKQGLQEYFQISY
ncbi:MAG: arylamine N-acetyltransferase [Bacillaceae bacterium]